MKIRFTPTLIKTAIMPLLKHFFQSQYPFIRKLKNRSSEGNNGDNREYAFFEPPPGDG